MPKPRKAWYNDGRINAETNTQNTKRTQERKDHVLQYGQEETEYLSGKDEKLGA